MNSPQSPNIVIFAAYYAVQLRLLYCVTNNQTVFFTDCPDIFTAHFYIREMVEKNHFIQPCITSSHTQYGLDMICKEAVAKNPDNPTYIELAIPEKINEQL